MREAETPVFVTAPVKLQTSHKSHQRAALHKHGNKPIRARYGAELLCWLKLSDLPFKLPGMHSPLTKDASPSAPRIARFPGRKNEASKAVGSPQGHAPSKNALRRTSAQEAAADKTSYLCAEVTSGRRRVYRARLGLSADGDTWEGFDMVEERQTHQGRLRGLVQSYLLPQGFPDSVAPEYATYMSWRGVQYFFGGAISVFTTKSLLGALGVAGRRSSEAAAAINWVIKDGAGRLGRLLFARWGRELDCELKQFRLMGDLLMESGAALELSTIFMPRAFLPLACTANLAKNLAAVAASSTRAPIYRTFALQNNMADVTAKGESVANLADILGTFAGILLSKAKLPLFPTFCFLSAGYLFASRKEVDSVMLPYLNRARLTYSAKRFLTSGAVPGVKEANKNEPLVPWGSHNHSRIVLGASVEQACTGPSELAFAMRLYHDERFAITYRPDAKKVFIILREGACPTDCLKAAFSANAFLHLLDGQQFYKQPAALKAAEVQAAKAIAATKKQEEQRWRQWLKRPLRLLRVRWPLVLGQQQQQRRQQLEQQVQHQQQVESSDRQEEVEILVEGQDAWRATMKSTKQAIEQLYPEFLKQAEAGGWKLTQTMLNPKESRLLQR